MWRVGRGLHLADAVRSPAFSACPSSLSTSTSSSSSASTTVSSTSMSLRQPRLARRLASSNAGRFRPGSNSRDGTSKGDRADTQGNIFGNRNRNSNSNSNSNSNMSSSNSNSYNRNSNNHSDGSRGGGRTTPPFMSSFGNKGKSAPTSSSSSSASSSATNINSASPPPLPPATPGSGGFAERFAARIRAAASRSAEAPSPQQQSGGFAGRYGSKPQGQGQSQGNQGAGNSSRFRSSPNGGFGTGFGRGHAGESSRQGFGGRGFERSDSAATGERPTFRRGGPRMDRGHGDSKLITRRSREMMERDGRPQSRAPSTTRPLAAMRSENMRPSKKPAPVIADSSEYYVSSSDDDSDDEDAVRKNRKNKKQKKRSLLARTEIDLTAISTPKSLSSLLGVRAVDIIKTMILLGEPPDSANALVPRDLAGLIASEYGATVIDRQAQAVVHESRLSTLTAEEKRKLPDRPPVVSVVGHINHGKTTLLDALRGSNIAAHEAGAITQHVGAFKAHLPSGTNLTVLDTPGHAAFMSLREQGVAVTDIGMLVVSADDGVQEQTLESAKALLASKTPFVVVINKCDLPDSDPERVKTELLQDNIAVEEYDGSIPCVEISALKRTGLEDLEVALQILAEDKRSDGTMRAPFDGPGEAIVVAPQSLVGLGKGACILMTAGQLQLRDYFVCGSTFGRVKKLLDPEAVVINSDQAGKALSSAGPSDPVVVMGFRDLPKSGEIFYVVSTEREARELAEKQMRYERHVESEKESKEAVEAYYASVEEARRAEADLLQKSLDDHAAGEGESEEAAATEWDTRMPEPVDVFVILRTDTQGSLEALGKALEDLPGRDMVRCKVVDSMVGKLSGGAVGRALNASQAARELTVAARKRPNSKLQQDQILRFAGSSGRELVLVVTFGAHDRGSRGELPPGVKEVRGDIIYSVVDGVQEHLTSLLPPKVHYDIVGVAECQQVFDIDTHRRDERAVAGCRVIHGALRRGSLVRLVRGMQDQGPSMTDISSVPGAQVLFQGTLASLKHHKDTVDVVNKGMECGTSLRDLPSDVSLAAGDRIFALKPREESRRLNEPW